MNNFIAIDVETANNQPTSICALGAVKVVGGAIVDKFYQLVKPEPEWYIRRFSEEIHGIFREDTADAPTFDLVWYNMLEQFNINIHNVCNVIFVAHNKAFDERCLRAAHQVYRIDWPSPAFYCTLTAARRKIPRQLIGSYSLPCVCDFMGIPFNNHHNALADAEACAKIAMTLL
jgi:DNA polymerase-3 subunit epsilon